MAEIKKIPFLLGDIGGTNVRLKLVNLTESSNPEVEELSSNIYSTTPQTIFDTIKSFISECFDKFSLKPNTAIFGVPGVIIGGTVIVSTQIPTFNGVSGKKLAEILGIENGIFLNDFNINGYAIQSNKLILGKDYIQLNPGVERVENESIGMIGTGTGLGMGYLTKPLGSSYYNVYSSEGGYADYPPTEEIEYKYKEYLSKKLKKNYINKEEALSGRSLGNLFLFFVDEMKEEPKNEKEKEILSQLKGLTEENYKENITKINKVILQEGIDLNNDLNTSICRKVVDRFVKMYASTASDIALSILPYGGLFLLGGLSEGLSSYMMKTGDFIKKFEDKGGLGVILKRIPIFVVVNLQFGVFGAEVYAKKLITERIKK